jgi:hypothetical protein
VVYLSVNTAKILNSYSCRLLLLLPVVALHAICGLVM